MSEMLRKRKSGMAGYPGRILILAVILPFIKCEPIRIAGGTSEVGNPKSGLYEEKGGETSSVRVTGFGFDNGTIRVISEKRESPQDSLETPAPADSASR